MYSSGISGFRSVVSGIAFSSEQGKETGRLDEWRLPARWSPQGDPAQPASPRPAVKKKARPQGHKVRLHLAAA